MANPQIRGSVARAVAILRANLGILASGPMSVGPERTGISTSGLVGTTFSDCGGSQASPAGNHPMAKEEFGDILIKRGIISRDQLNEADQMARDQDYNVADCLQRLGYATGEEVMRAMADFHKMEFVDLTEFQVPEDVIELVPESVARENVALPLAHEDEALKVAISDPFDIETIEKLRFILNRQVETALAPRENILEAINRHYGQVEGESADSMLQEFTDTAIDFTETEESDVSSSEIVDETSAPVVRMVQLMIQEAVQLRASDIHIEPFEDRIRDALPHRRRADRAR